VNGAREESRKYERVGVRLQASGLQASGFRASGLQASGFRLQASGFRLQASGFRIRVHRCSHFPFCSSARAGCSLTFASEIY
jgi:hypothetical protein